MADRSAARIAPDPEHALPPAGESTPAKRGSSAPAPPDADRALPAEGRSSAVVKEPGVQPALPSAPEAKPEWRPRTAPPPANPRNPDEARKAIAQTRSRLSETLSELEERLVEKKKELREKTDLSARLREVVAGREIPALIAAVGVGLLAALLLGGRSSSGGQGGLSGEEREALRMWRGDRERILTALDRIAEGVEEE